MGFEYVPASSFIVVDSMGKWDPRETAKLAQQLNLRERALDHGIVVCGYNAIVRGTRQIATLRRGGTDRSANIIAYATRARECENWKGRVDGVLAVSPEIYANARKIDFMTHREMEELANMGSEVLQREAIEPARLAGIPIHIRCIKKPASAGTWVYPDHQRDHVKKGTITGIAIRRGYVRMEVGPPQNEFGFDGRVDNVLKKFGINWPHKTTGTVPISTAIATDQLRGKREQMQRQLISECGAEYVHFDKKGLSNICIVGEGIEDAPGVSGRALWAIGKRGIVDRLVSKGGSTVNLVVFVDEEDDVEAARAVYNEFFG
jgi:aspartate kinase